MTLDTQKMLGAFPALLAEAIGGDDVVRMLSLHHTEGTSYRRLAADFGFAESVVRTKLARARVKLRRLDLMPEAWDHPNLNPASDRN